MWIFLIPLIIAELLFWFALVYFARLAYRALKSKHWVSFAFWTSLILIPFVFYQYKHFQADKLEAKRASEIAALTRIAPLQTYPKLLEVYGNLTDFELLIMLSVMKFEQVAVLQRPRKNNIYGNFVTLAPGCQSLGYEHLKTWEKRGRFGAPEKKDKDCLIREWKTISQDRSAVAAVEFRHGTHSTLIPRGNNWSDGAYEVRVRTLENTSLVEFWERPYITRPMWPGPWGYAYPSNTDSKKYKQPKRLDFFLNAMGLSKS